MADRTRYDLTLIKDCSRSLSKIHDEFERNGNPADEYGDELGHGGLKEAFEDFGSTWKKTRKKLMKEIEKLADATRVAAEKYEEIDHELAKAIESAKGKSNQ